MNVKTALIVWLSVLSWVKSEAQERKHYIATRVNGFDITIDGNLNEPAWQAAIWEGNFVQYQPVEGIAPYQQTEFALMYDDNNLYVGIKALDNSPDSIVMRMTRRDMADGDEVGIGLDTYNDMRTAFAFGVTAAGVKLEWMFINDGETEDFSWDPIWWVKTSKNDEGWFAEMRIPLTQLRFKKEGDQIWGFQVYRKIFRKEDLSSWQPMQRGSSGLVSQFGTMNGLKDISSKKTRDLMPYVVARTDRFEPDSENPFMQTGRKNFADAGLDAKIGLTNNLTLDLTVNPDFGQVEADPSEVNLTTRETFFPEKRPFFIEGNNILQYKLMFGDGDLAYDGLFYSRRIGTRPHYSPETNDGEYISQPKAVRILGASKVTGKTASGWSIGVLESVTSEEHAEIRSINSRQSVLTEPLTNYFVARLQKDFNDNNTYLGGMVTAVNRDIKDFQPENLHTAAYSGGIDFIHKWNNKSWVADAALYFSRVQGSRESITQLQESYIHAFQRPDADYVRYDTTRTSLTGHGGKITVGKLGGNLKFMAGGAWKSPELELNDVGYAQQVDNIFQILWVGYRVYKPVFIFRDINLNFNQWVQFDFGGNVTAPGGNINWYTNLKNFWAAYGGFILEGEQRYNTVLRGGPALKIPGYRFVHFGFSSNQQKKLTLRFSTGHNYSKEENFDTGHSYSLNIGYRPVNALRVDLSPGYSTSYNMMQYVTQTDQGSEKRYIMAGIDRTTLSMSLRFNYYISPNLTIQFWGQPFIASGKYADFKYIIDSKANNLHDRFQLYAQDQISLNEAQDVYHVDENLDNSSDYSFDRPDFNVKEFLSNLVVRWEYRPGSTLYLVWSQNRNTSITEGSFQFNRDVNALLDEKGYNVYLIKLSYRIGR